MKIKILARNGNLVAILFALIWIVIVLIVFMMAIKPYALLNTYFTENSDYLAYNSPSECDAHGGSWNGATCQYVEARAEEVIAFNKKIWLISPFILILSLIIWIFTIATGKDTSYYLR